jgi:hypothetical protein
MTPLCVTDRIVTAVTLTWPVDPEREWCSNVDMRNC